MTNVLGEVSFAKYDEFRKTVKFFNTIITCVQLFFCNEVIWKILNFSAIAHLKMLPKHLVE